MSQLIAALGGFVLERQPDGRFAQCGRQPAWCQELSGMPMETPFFLAERFPFLESFLPTAEDAWRDGSSAVISSGYWTETGRQGQDIHLEAQAVRVGAQHILVILRNERLFQTHLTVFQRARELRLTHDELLREMEQRDVLLHTIIHDLASPLHSILGLLTLLDEDRLREPAAEWVRRALVAARLQKELIGEVLEVFSVEDSPANLSPRATQEVRSVVRQVVAELAPVASARDLRLDASSDGQPCHVACDERRLIRVVSNLIHNAISRSAPGDAILIQVEAARDSVCITVEDQGDPVPLERLPRLFEKFLQRDEQGGVRLGLSLYFCRITVERWGGGIGYQPNDEAGARFWMRLPTTAYAPGA